MGGGYEEEGKGYGGGEDDEEDEEVRAGKDGEEFRLPGEAGLDVGLNSFCKSNC